MIDCNIRRKCIVVPRRNSFDERHGGLGIALGVGEGVSDEIKPSIRQNTELLNDLQKNSYESNFHSIIVVIR